MATLKEAASSVKSSGSGSSPSPSPKSSSSAGFGAKATGNVSTTSSIKTNDKLKAPAQKTKSVTVGSSKNGAAAKTGGFKQKVQEYNSYSDKNDYRMQTARGISHFYTQYGKFLNNDKRNETDWKDFGSEAKRFYSQATDPEKKQIWKSISDTIDSDIFSYYKNELSKLDASIEGYKKNYSDAENEYRSLTDNVLVWQTDSTSAEYKDAATKAESAQSRMKTAKGQRERAEARREEILNARNDYFMTDEEHAAKEFLESGGSSHGDVLRSIAMMTPYGQRPMTAEEAAVWSNVIGQGNTAQQIMDDFNRSMGDRTQYYNMYDRMTGSAQSGAIGVAGALVGAVGTASKMATETGNQHAKRATDSIGGVGTYDSAVEAAEERAAGNRPTIGGLIVPSSEEISNLRAAAAKEDVVGKPYNPLETSATETLQKNADAWSRNADNLQTELDAVQKQIEDFKRSAPGSGEVDLTQFANLKKQEAQLKKDIKDARDIASQYGGSRASIGYAIRHGTMDDINHVIDQSSWEISDAANEELRKSTEKANPIEKTILHMTKTGVEMGFDAIVGAATGTGGLPVMFTRVFGQASQEANRQGASLPKQVLYGAAVAGVEVLTEKMADFAGGAIYGKGFTGDFAKELIHKLEVSPIFEKAMYIAADSLGEAFEEGAADVLGGLAEMIIRYDPEKTAWDNFKDLTAEQCADVWYDMLLGGLMGLIGAPIGVMTGSYNETLQGMYEADIQNDIDNAKKQAAIDRSAYNEAEKYGTQADVEKVISDAANRPDTRSPITKAMNKNNAGEALTRKEASILRAAGIPIKSPISDFKVNSTPSNNSAGVSSTESRIGDVGGRGENRALKIADQLAGGFEVGGYTAPVGQNEAYNTATTGSDERRPASAPPIEAPEQGVNVKGGDAANYGTPSQTPTNAPQGQGGSQGTDTATQSNKSVKPTNTPATAAQGREAIENGSTNNKQLAEVVSVVDAAVSAEKPVHVVNGNIFKKTGEQGELPLSKKVWNWLKRNFSDNGAIFSNKLNSDVIVNERGIKNDVAHGVGDAKTATFVAVPYVIKNGKIVSKTEENGKTTSIIMAGKVYLNDANGKNGMPVNVYCLLKADDSGQNRFYLHEVSDGQGHLFYQLDNAEKGASSALQDSTPQKQGSAEETPSARSIPQTPAPSKGNSAEQENVPQQKGKEGRKKSGWSKSIRSESPTGLLDGSDKTTAEKAGWSQEELDYIKEHGDSFMSYSWAKEAAIDGKLVSFIVGSGVSNPVTYIYDGHTVYSVQNGKLVKECSGVSAFKWMESPRVARSMESYRPSEMEVDELDSILQNSKLKYERDKNRYTPTEKEVKDAFDEYLKHDLNPYYPDVAEEQKLVVKALLAATPEHPLVLKNGRLVFDGAVLTEYNIGQYGKAVLGRTPVVYGTYSTNHAKTIVDELRLYEFHTTDGTGGKYLNDFIAEAKALSQQQPEQRPKESSTGTAGNGIIEENERSVDTNDGKRRFVGDHGQASEGTDARGAAGVHRVLERSLEESHGQAETDSARYSDEGVRNQHLATISEFEERGARYVPDAEKPAFAKAIEKIAQTIGISNVSFLYAPKSYEGTRGLYDDYTKTAYLVLQTGTKEEIQHVAKHEFLHSVIEPYLAQADSPLNFNNIRNIVEGALSNTSNVKESRKVFDRAYDRVSRFYAVHYCESIREEYTPEEWAKVDPDDQKYIIESVISEEEAQKLYDRTYVEFVVEALCDSQGWFVKGSDMSEFQSEIQRVLNNEHIIPENLIKDIDGIDFSEENESETSNYEDINSEQASELDQLRSENEALRNELAELKAASESEESVGRTPGKTGQESKSAARKRMTAKGEDANTRNQAKEIDEEYGTGDGTFTSRTNEDRSRTADSLTDTQDKADEQAKRLLEEGYNWNDDDVVIAEKLMHDMIRSIRDYQLHKRFKISEEGFKALTKQYNALALKHTAEKSRMGQALQAEYTFSTSEKIMMRAAKTFLGFTADGRFAGKSPFAKYAKIYGGMEAAASKIDTAVEAGDTAALAQVCKDLSDIRNVKKMFGPLSGFVSGIENKVLDRIANSEHAVEALSTLAYGNLNAICDDVQPYKVMNAVKTIRVMNMLSALSTINNNIFNNISSGITSTNALAQAANRIAAKPFENLTGQKVLARQGKGWLANKEIRTAEMDALNLATLVQLYGINNERGKLELGSDKGLFNPNANAFEQTMSLYKFFIGMGVEATDQIKSAGLQKSMNIGIDEALRKGEITEAQAEQMRQEAKHEVDRLLYKDDNKLTHEVERLRSFLNKISPGGDGKHGWGNENTGYIGLGDITMAFAKVPANVVRARLMATPEGALLNVAQYFRGVNKAKRMHSEVVARGIMEDSTLSDGQKWAKCRQECSGSVYNKLRKISDNFAQSIPFDECCARAHINEAKEMSQFEMAQISRNIGRAATTAGMVALGSLLRGLGALKDFDQEPDEELRKMWAQKGYSGLMMNLSAIGRKDHEWRDGDLVMGGDWLEVIAMPLAIGACATEAAMSEDDWKKGGGAYMTELATGGLGKAFDAIGDLPGMADAINFYNAMTNQFSDNAAKGNRLKNSLIEYAASSLPSFFIPNAFSQTAAGIDNTVRDVYTTDNVWQQAWNIVKNKGGVMIRQTIPASVDMWGNERTYGDNRVMGVINKAVLPGTGIRTYKESKYEKEIIRLERAGYSGAAPKITVNSSFEVDGETYTMDAEDRREFKYNRNTAQAAAYQAFMDSDYYNKLNDEQKTAVIKNLKMDAERDAKQTYLKDNHINAEVTRAKWETELNLDEQITYLSDKERIDGFIGDEKGLFADYEGLDNFMTNEYGKLPEGVKALLDDKYSVLDDLDKARKDVGMGSKDFETLNNIHYEYNEYAKTRDKDEESMSEVNRDMAVAFHKANVPTKYADWATDNMPLYSTFPANIDTPKKIVAQTGMSWEEADEWLDTKSNTAPAGGHKALTNNQIYMMIRDSKYSEAKKWKLLEYEASDSAWDKLKPFKDQGQTVAYALKNARWYRATKYSKYVPMRYDVIYDDDWREVA